MSTKVIYPLGWGSNWKNTEIKLSIQQLRKHCQDEIEIIVVGENPNIQGVNWIPNSPRGTKYNNVARNLLKGMEQAGNYVLMNDDFFVIKPFSFEDMPLYYDGLLADRINQINVNNAYHRVLKNSTTKYSDLNFAVHYPFPVRNWELFLQVLEQSLKKGISHRCVYGNQVDDKKEQKKDMKFFRNIGFSDFLEQVASCDWFSIGDGFLTQTNKNNLVKFLENE
jgi:hypothetical protein